MYWLKTGIWVNKFSLLPQAYTDWEMSSWVSVFWGLIFFAIKYPSSNRHLRRCKKPFCVPCFQPSILTELLEPQCLFHSTVCSVPTACSSNQWNTVWHWFLVALPYDPRLPAGYRLWCACCSFLAPLRPPVCLGSLPRQHLVVNPGIPFMNLWSFSLITTPHSGSLRRQLGCISLDGVHLMYLMFTLRLSSQPPDTVFVLTYQTQTRMLSQMSVLKW